MTDQTTAAHQLLDELLPEGFVWRPMEELMVDTGESATMIREYANTDGYILPTLQSALRAIQYGRRMTAEEAEVLNWCLEVPSLFVGGDPTQYETTYTVADKLVEWGWLESTGAIAGVYETADPITDQVLASPGFRAAIGGTADYSGVGPWMIRPAATGAEVPELAYTGQAPNTISFEDWKKVREAIDNQPWGQRLHRTLSLPLLGAFTYDQYDMAYWQMLEANRRLVEEIAVGDLTSEQIQERLDEQRQAFEDELVTAGLYGGDNDTGWKLAWADWTEAGAYSPTTQAIPLEIVLSDGTTLRDALGWSILDSDPVALMNSVVQWNDTTKSAAHPRGIADELGLLDMDPRDPHFLPTIWNAWMVKKNGSPADYDRLAQALIDNFGYVTVRGRGGQEDQVDLRARDQARAQWLHGSNNLDRYIIPVAIGSNQDWRLLNAVLMATTDKGQSFRGLGDEEDTRWNGATMQAARYLRRFNNNPILAAAAVEFGAEEAEQWMKSGIVPFTRLGWLSQMSDTLGPEGVLGSTGYPDSWRWAAQIQQAAEVENIIRSITPDPVQLRQTVQNMFQQYGLRNPTVQELNAFMQLPAQVIAEYARSFDLWGMQAQGAASTAPLPYQPDISARLTEAFRQTPLYRQLYARKPSSVSEGDFVSNYASIGAGILGFRPSDEIIRRGMESGSATAVYQAALFDPKTLQDSQSLRGRLARLARVINQI